MVKPIAKVIFLSAGLLSVAGTASYASTLLTGEVASAQSQTVTAPKSTGWQIQIQWLEEEGTIVKEGDLVAVFDSGGIQTQLEENQENLQTQKLQLLKIEMDVNQAVVEAEGRLKLATIQVKKDRIEANIPKGEVSDYEKGKFIIAYEKALMEQIKAEENLKLKLAERDVARIQVRSAPLAKLGSLA